MRLGAKPPPGLMERPGSLQSKQTVPGLGNEHVEQHAAIVPLTERAIWILKL